MNIMKTLFGYNTQHKLKLTKKEVEILLSNTTFPFTNSVKGNGWITINGIFDFHMTQLNESLIAANSFEKNNKISYDRASKYSSAWVYLKDNGFNWVHIEVSTDEVDPSKYDGDPILIIAQFWRFSAESLCSFYERYKDHNPSCLKTALIQAYLNFFHS